MSYTGQLLILIRMALCVTKRVTKRIFDVELKQLLSCFDSTSATKKNKVKRLFASLMKKINKTVLTSVIHHKEKSKSNVYLHL